MTTNGTRLAEHAGALVDAGVRRVNVSLDTLDPDRFRFITRHGDVAQVIGGIRAARDAEIRDAKTLADQITTQVAAKIGTLPPAR